MAGVSGYADHRFKSTVEELSTFPVIEHVWHETSAFTKRFEPSDQWCLNWREPWSGAMVLRLAVWAGIQGMTPET